MEDWYDSLALVEQLSRSGIFSTDGWYNTTTVAEHDIPNHFLMYRVERVYSLCGSERDTINRSPSAKMGPSIASFSTWKHGLKILSWRFLKYLT